MAMTKKDFINLADVVREQRPYLLDGQEAYHTWERVRDTLADFCSRQNPDFKRERWLDYIAGKCGPSGKVKAPKARKYRGYTIEPVEYQGCDNFRVRGPDGTLTWGEISADIRTARKWIDAALA